MFKALQLRHPQLLHYLVLWVLLLQHHEGQECKASGLTLDADRRQVVVHDLQVPRGVSGAEWEGADWVVRSAVVVRKRHR